MSSHKDLIAKLGKTLEEWDYQIDRLEHRVQGAPAELKSRLDDKMKSVQKYKAIVKDKISEIEKASNTAVDELNKTADDAWSSLKTAYDDLKSEFKSDE